VSVYLKDRDPDPLLQLLPIGAAEAAEKLAEQQSRQDLRSARAQAYAADSAKVIDYANRMGLTVTKQDPARRLVKLSGPAERFEAAFRTKLHHYHDGKQAFRARAGSLSAPDDVVDAIEAVL